ARIQDHAVENVGIGERDPERHACAAGESAEVDALRIDRVTPHDVLFRKNGERLPPAQHALVVTRLRGTDEYDAALFEHADPGRRNALRVPGRHEHEQPIAVRGLLRRYVEDELFLGEIDRLLAQDLSHFGGERRYLCGFERRQKTAGKFLIAAER